MDNAELGRRLKAARLAKKMTQSEVVGDFITRNMLSQIESGTATPSMKTLEYLASVLDLPMDKLLADSGETTVQSSITVLQEVRQLIRSKRYAEALAVEDVSGTIDDELHALRSIAHLELARQMAASRHTEQLQMAVIHARSAAQEAALGLYANADRAAKAGQIIAEAAQYLSSYYQSLASGSDPAIPPPSSGGPNGV